MDTSKEYIKMCQMASKIQKSWNMASNDYFVNIPKFNENKYGHGNDCWLPRQGQLQRMVFNRYDGYRWLILDFAKWSGEYKDRISLSLEQLWLSYVMDKIFNQQWNGEIWE